VAVAAGEPAPRFSLSTLDGAFTRADLEGRITVLVFYPFAFSPVCTEQLSVYDQLRDEFEARGATLYAVSCDHPFSQRAFKEHLGVEIAQLSDFEPKGETCRAFGVYSPAGFAERALVMTGPDAVVRWSHQEPDIGGVPGANLIFDALGG
jgi:peroxiredoxin